MEDAKQSVHANEQVKNELANLASKKQDNNLITEIKPQTERIEWIIVLRAIACMAVVMNHVVGWFYVNLEITNRVNYGPFRMFFDEILLQPFICFAIPCFFMISGSLLLDPKRDLSLKKLIKKIIKMLSIIVIFSFAFVFCYALANHIYSLENFSLQSIFSKVPLMFYESFLDVFIRADVVHFWYLCTLIGLYIITPVLRLFTKYADLKTIKFTLLTLFITTSLIPTLNNYFNFNIETFTEISCYVFLYLIGYYIVNTDYIKNTYIYVGGIIGFIIYIIACCLRIEDQLDVFMILEAIMIIRFISSQNTKIKSNKMLNLIAKYSLGIYVIHPFWLAILAGLKIYFTIFPVIIGEVIFFTYTLIMSLLTSIILYRLPLIKKMFR